MQQTDVKASAPLTASGALLDGAGKALGRVRIKALSFNGGAGSIVLLNGVGGPPLLNIAVAAPGYMLLPGEGILADTALAATLTGVTSLTVIYG